MINDAAHRGDVSKDAIFALQHRGLTGRLLPPATA